jgi:hypothetical protein
MAGSFVTIFETTAPRMATSFISMIEPIFNGRQAILHPADKARYLWKTLIPIESQHDAATQYGAVALGTVYQSLGILHTSGWENEVFAKYYNKSHYRRQGRAVL